MATTERIFVHLGNHRREFLLRVPGQHSRHLPLVIMFHGTGGTAAWAEDETGWSDLADREGFAVAYPEGLPPDPARPPKFLTNPPIWHDGSFGPADHAAEAYDRHFLSTMLDMLMDRLPVDPRRVFATGFSNGAGMTFALAAAMSERLAGIAPVAGHCWIDQPRLAEAVPTLYLVGDRDPLIPLEGGPVRTPWGYTRNKPSVADTLNKWSQALGCPSAPTLNPLDLAESGMPDDERLIARMIPGLGHHWPGGKGKLSERMAGPRSSTINACDHIWQWFQTIAERPKVMLGEPLG